MRRKIAVLTVILVVALFCSPAAASINVGNRYQIDWHPVSGQSQGPFEYIRVSPNPPGDNPNLGVFPEYRTDQSYWDDTYFWTYCVERTEYFYPGNTYEINDIGFTSWKTGRLMTGYTAWIYTMFWGIDGWTLPDEILHDGISGSEYNLLQNAVWAGMVKIYKGEDGHITGYGAVGDSDAELEISDWGPYHTKGIAYEDFLASSWGGGVSEAQALAYPGRVGVLNMYDTLSVPQNYKIQDHLGIVSSQQTIPPIPEPASILIWCLLGAGSWLGMRVWRGGRRVGRPAWSPENRQAIHEIIARGNPC